MPAQMNELFDVVKSGVGDKLGTFIFSATSCLAGIIYSMFFGAGYGGICAIYLPFIFAIIGIFGIQVKKTAQGRIDVAKSLGGIAEETLTAIKVVSSFGREDREISKFEKQCQFATDVSKKATRTMATMVGLMKFVMFTFYTYAMFVGSRYMLNHGYT
jgi:subfamily B ATP-binding cassette protein MsbA